MNPNYSGTPVRAAAGRLCDAQGCRRLEVIRHLGYVLDSNDSGYLVGRLWRQLHNQNLQAVMWYQRGRPYRYKFLPLNPRDRWPRPNTISSAFGINNKNVILGVVNGRRIVQWTRIGPKRNPNWRFRNISRPIFEALSEYRRRDIYFLKGEINDCGDMLLSYARSIENYSSKRESIFVRNNARSC